MIHEDQVTVSFKNEFMNKQQTHNMETQTKTMNRNKCHDGLMINDLFLMLTYQKQK